jgi:hypothetical protein
MISQASNPATRLVAVVEILESSNGGLAAKEILANALGVASSDNIKFPLKMSQLAYLIDSVERQTRSVLPEEDLGLFLPWVAPLRTLVAQRNLDANWGSMANFANKDVLSPLRFTARELSKFVREQTLTDEQRESIRGEVADFLSEVQGSDLEEPLRSYVVDHLEAALTALQDYALLGVKPLRDVVEHALGSAALDSEVRQRGGTSKWVKRTWEILGRIATVLAMGDDALRLGTTVFALTTGTPTPPH